METSSQTSKAGSFGEQPILNLKLGPYKMRVLYRTGDRPSLNLRITKRSLLIALLACGLSTRVSAQSSYVVRNVSVIGARGDYQARRHDVVIRGRHIIRLSNPGSENAAGAVVIEGTGKFLMPGLIDSHVHIKPEDSLFLFVVNGVTTVQNMAGQPFHLRLRQQTNEGTLLGPRVITTGPNTARAGVQTPADAEKLVLDQKAAGYHAIKQYGSDRRGAMEREVYRTLRATARAQGMRLVGHAPRNLPFQVVLDERQNSVDHMEEIVYTHAPFGRVLKPYVDLQFGRASSASRDSLLQGPVPDFVTELRVEIQELARAVKASGVAVTPNLGFFRNIQRSTNDSIHALLRDPDLAYAAPGLRLNWSPMLNRYRNAWRDRDLISRYLGEVVELQSAITAAFHEAGVPLMTGTDSEGLGAQPGFGLHTELELFVRAGMTTADALRYATIVPARVLQIADSVGSIEPGKIADLVLFAANPLSDIRNTRRIDGVFRAGRWISGEAGQAMLDSLARSYAPVQTALSEFIQVLEQEGAVAALEVYRPSPQRAHIAKSVESVIDSYGYRMLGDGRVKEAIEVFRANAAAFPTEYNTWDSLAKAYMTNQQNDLAIKYYRKVLQMHPGDGNATSQLKRLGVTP